MQGPEFGKLIESPHTRGGKYRDRRAQVDRRGFRSRPNISIIHWYTNDILKFIINHARPRRSPRINDTDKMRIDKFAVELDAALGPRAEFGRFSRGEIAITAKLMYLYGIAPSGELRNAKARDRPFRWRSQEPAIRISRLGDVTRRFDL